jgi:hypothetical protein
MILFVASDCPSDWGWNAEDRFNWTLVSWNSSRHKLLVKTGSGSLMMELRIPWSRTMLLKNARGDGGGHIWVCQGDEVCVLGKTIHHHEDDRFPIHARQPLDETMAISAHTDDGSASGWSSPTGYNCLVLFRWQTTHTQTKSRTTSHVPGT